MEAVLQASNVRDAVEWHPYKSWEPQFYDEAQWHLSSFLRNQKKWESPDPQNFFVHRPTGSKNPWAAFRYRGSVDLAGRRQNSGSFYQSLRLSLWNINRREISTSYKSLQRTECSTILFLCSCFH